MTEFFKALGCPLQLVEDFKTNSMARHVLLLFGTFLAVFGFFMASKLDRSEDSKTKLCVAALLILGAVGVFLMAFAIVLFIMAEDRSLLEENEARANDQPAGTDSEILIQFQHAIPLYDDLELVTLTSKDVNLTIKNPPRTVKFTNLQELHAFQQSAN